MGDGAIISLSRKQDMNTRSSTEAEVVAGDKTYGHDYFLRHKDIQLRRISSIKTTEVPCCLRPMDARVLASTLVI